MPDLGAAALRSEDSDNFRSGSAEMTVCLFLYNLVVLFGLFC